MIVAISFGFGVIFLLSYWLSARVGAKRQSVWMGLFSGVISYIVMLICYLAGLTLYARAQLVAFINEELPLLVDRVMQTVDRLTLIQDKI